MYLIKKETTNVVFILVQLNVSFFLHLSNKKKAAKYDLGRMDLIFPVIYFLQLISFYTPWKYQKTSGLLILLEGIEIDQLRKMGYDGLQNMQ